ncbi:MAG TPA: hypothetical protein VHV82_00185 [Sporichthyaceae bacterium]|jgi:hypothetical protein|nr:hypothetical protein [Sporichthyaceae bacterium]
MNRSAARGPRHGSGCGSGARLLPQAALLGGPARQIRVLCQDGVLA